MACVLVLTVGDYLLWNWSLASNHVILSLLAGLTLLPLAAVSLGLIALATLGLLARVARTSSTMARSMHAHKHIAAVEPPAPPRDEGRTASSAEPKSSSGRLAA